LRRAAPEKRRRDKLADARGYTRYAKMSALAFRKRKTVMTTARDILTPHLEAALAEANEKKMSSDAVARILFEQALRIWKESRSPEDIRAELLEAADHLDPDEDFTFMRP
jgi:hypothetical protein